MKLKYFAVAALAALLGLSACSDDKGAQSEAKANSSESKKIVVATSANFAPFEFVDGGEFKGIDMDIARHIAKELNAELVISDMEFDSVVTSVASSKAKLAISGLTVNEARQKVINFSDNYYSASQMVIVKKDDERFNAITDKDALIKALNEAKGLKIGVQVGTTGLFYAKGDADWGFEGFKDAKVESYPNAGSATNDMLNGRVDVVIIDEMPARELVKSNPATKLLDIPLTDEKYAIGIDPKESELKAKVDKILSDMKADGTLDNIISAYFSESK